MTIVPREDIEGWFDWPDIYKEAVDSIPSTGQFIEVGTWMGKSACYLAELIKDSDKEIAFYCIDLWDDQTTEEAYRGMVNISKAEKITLLDKFISNLEKYEVDSYMIPIKGDSAESATLFSDKSCDLIFIDASHEYEQVKKDLVAWWPKLKDGGIFAGHDYLYSPNGVQKAVKEFFVETGRTFSVRNQCWYIRK